MNVNDKVSMEYEARATLSEEQYQKIKDFYLSKEKEVRQLTNTNTYFDTDDLYLTFHHMVLRIRQIDNKEDELTLKIKGEKGDIEITNKLEKEAASALLNGKNIDFTNINSTLIDRGVDIDKLHVITTLTTERIEINYPDYLLVIDKNMYRDVIDYNIEVESTSRDLAAKYLLEVITPFGVEYKKDYVSKSRRAILYK